MSGDRKYKAEDMALHFSKVLTNGVMPSGTQLQATADSGMSIIVSAGSAWINGYAYHNDSNFTLTIDPADGVLNRIDRIVVRWSRLDRAINLVVIKGVAASTPAAPALVRSVDSYDLCIATISVGMGITGITQAMITDTRMDGTVCGFVSSLIQPDTAGWFTQFDTAFNDAISENQSDWAAWFATVQDILDEDTAGNLLNLINGKTDKVTSAVAGNLAGLDADGNLTDSGIDPSDLSAKAHADTHATGGTDPITADSIGALPKAGGTMTGALNFTSGIGYGTTLPSTGLSAGRIFFLKV